MAKQCYLLLFTNCSNFKGHGYLCVDSVATTPGSCGVVLVINGVNTGIGEKEATFIPVKYAGAYPIPPEYSTRYDSEYYGSCCNPPNFTFYCQGSKQAKVTVLNQEYIFQNAPIKVSCEGTTLIIEDSSGGGTNVGVPNCNSYKVSCDDDCPDGYCKIDCEAYPGYCCLNEAEIQSLSNQLR
ncbi:MAG: hypothetical protein V7K14_30640 [Nostoc sp.]|uniref:hypothetical protein n=1 Tax=Nostoc sp. TaxID=1180 RepID=UPI002FF82C10